MEVVCVGPGQEDEESALYALSFERPFLQVLLAQSDSCQKNFDCEFGLISACPLNIFGTFGGRKLVVQYNERGQMVCGPDSKQVWRAKPEHPFTEPSSWTVHGGYSW